MASRFHEYGDESARRPRRQEQDDLSDNEGWDQDEETDIDREWYLQDDEAVWPATLTTIHLRSMRTCMARYRMCLLGASSA